MYIRGSKIENNIYSVTLTGVWNDIQLTMALWFTTRGKRDKPPDFTTRVMSAAISCRITNVSVCNHCGKKVLIEEGGGVTEDTLQNLPRRMMLLESDGHVRSFEACCTNCSVDIVDIMLKPHNVDIYGLPGCFTCGKIPANLTEARRHFSHSRMILYNHKFVSVFYVCNVECKNAIMDVYHKIIGPGEQTCITCGTPKSETHKLKRCSRCGESYYCDTNCQRDHWKYHKIICDEIVREKKGVPVVHDVSSGYTPSESRT